MPAYAADDDIWAQDAMDVPPIDGQGDGEMIKERIEHRIEELAKADPQRAEELRNMMKNDPQAFRQEMQKMQGDGQMQGQRMGEERMQMQGQEGKGLLADKMMPREQLQQWHTDFIKWLNENYPDESAKLDALKGDQRAHIRTTMLLAKKYGPVMRASQNDPQLAELLKSDIELRDRRNEIVRKI